MPEDALTLATIGLVMVTLVLASATMLLWWEARRQRVEASVVATVAPWEVAYGLYIALLIENAGPSIARDVNVKWRLDRKVDAKQGAIREATFGVGFRRTVLPIRSGTTMDQLVAEKASVHVELSWRDGRRGVQRQTIDTTVEAVRAAYADSGALPRPNLIETLSQIRDHLKTIAEK